MNGISSPAISPPERAGGRRAGLLVPALALLVAGCSWMPFIGAEDGPHLTNPAVQACEHKADALGYEGIAEHETTPGADGRYTVVLDVRQNEGYGQISCAFDPAKGAEIAPPSQAKK